MILLTRSFVYLSIQTRLKIRLTREQTAANEVHPFKHAAIRNNVIRVDISHHR